MIEGFASCLLVFASGAASSGLATSNASTLAISAYAALTNAVSLSLFVFAAAPASGGHLNPSITMATFFAGLSTLPRSVVYIAAQCTGAIVGGYWLRLGLGEGFFPTVSSDALCFECISRQTDFRSGSHTRLHCRRGASVSRPAFRPGIHVRSGAYFPRFRGRPGSSARKGLWARSQSRACWCDPWVRDSCIVGSEAGVYGCL